jgi:hypothetical protein
VAAEGSFCRALLLRSTLDFLDSRFGFRFRVAMQMQFAQIVRRADEFPFTGDQVQASQSETARVTPLFDLSEDRFDRCFSQAVAPLTVCGGQKVAHPLSLLGVRRFVGDRFSRAGALRVGSHQNENVLEKRIS